ncbi:AraC family transcriptional regulator [Parabacteroides sp. PF5-5]|uniref:AraC family transcriptional regulator n=1 Tax=unclassified Parabacteroides TaxID=2649774 RepID=UPI002473FFB5|nr:MULTISPECIES: GyrI-like domain-containing protein [unclassified Parabacteroides]MDH6307001.1 AraC family transcriptional regulator [Parabacteroides sp. PH5-39]MDH6317867.1 AraC family transcriptional regulator [Parabacteroides sp. PF5-13]MDH6321629.1 AraC family transcriptional regulator [Parabacteroides sp. PH5-13]MDH6325388.1 AraC family transcriptional regulator [Parabacteroides sp. PH5-8]MDH6329104.1 AraC family transcriptional regulator [Parabacteroides sp. PH5-41]
MNIQENSRIEYRARINRVMDYIQQNLDKQIDLGVMAEIASFSPYHFHRIFTYIVGETPNEFVSRIRLEKAALLLFVDTNTLVRDIAFHCGFANVSSFSRTFKTYFGLTPKEFREQEKAIYLKDGIRYGKNCKAVSKIGKHPQQVNIQLCSVEFNKLIIMDTKIEVKQMPELNLIYCRHTGAFNKIGQAYEKLFRWAIPRGLVTPETKTITVYRDDPAITTIEKVRQDASIIVKSEIKVEGEISKSTLPAGKYAVGRFEIKETEFEEAWNTMCAWLTESGYQPDDNPTYEYYHNDYSEHPEHKFIVDICIPVKPL